MDIGIGEHWELNEYGMKEYPEGNGFGKRHGNVAAWAELPSPYIKERAGRNE